MTFKRVAENFICLKCQAEVIGNGYTNHCPNCLYSQHVDHEFPGDRSSLCHGLMQPIGVILKGGLPYRIKFICKKCKKEIFNLVAKEDQIESLRKLPTLLKAC